MTVQHGLGRILVLLGAILLPSCAAAAPGEAAAEPVRFEAPAGSPVARHGALSALSPWICLAFTTSVSSIGPGASQNAEDRYFLPVSPC